jgi:excinuclease ABC subunit C
MKKSDYRKFIIRGLAESPMVAPAAANSNELVSIGVPGSQDVPAVPVARQNDDFASMHEAVLRRYRRVLEEKKPLPSLILIDGGVGQLHAAARALDELQIINQPIASIAKKEEILYVLGQEDEPCILDYHSPVLHLIQQIRDETHRFAVTFHRQRRGAKQIRTALLDIPGIGPQTSQRLLQRFGSVANLKRATRDELTHVVSKKSAEKILTYFANGNSAS